MAKQRKRSPKVDKVREIDVDNLWWPTVEQAGQRLGGNLQYTDFRDLSWEEANGILTFEEELLVRINESDDPDTTHDEILDELCEDPEGLFGLDLGVAKASAVQQRTNLPKVRGMREPHIH